MPLPEGASTHESEPPTDMNHPQSQRLPCNNAVTARHLTIHFILVLQPGRDDGGVHASMASAAGPTLMLAAIIALEVGTRPSVRIRHKKVVDSMCHRQVAEGMWLAPNLLGARRFHVAFQKTTRNLMWGISTVSTSGLKDGSLMSWNPGVIVRLGVSWMRQ